MSGDTVLSVRGLGVRARATATTVVDDVAFDLARGQTLAIVGESGSGKTTVALALLGLLPEGLAVHAGSALLDGDDLLAMGPRALRSVRGRRIGTVFQNPMTALNPVRRVGEQVAEAVRAHERVARDAARRRAVELLELVRLPDAAAAARRWPHELSGGMRQRVQLAIAVALGPAVLIADEPTTALDVTVQAEVLAVLDDAARATGAATLLVTHDLGIVAERAHRVVVLYAGRVVETGTVEAVFATPRHPYTAALLACVPRPDRRAPIAALPGRHPDPGERPGGCAFHPRCALAGDHAACRTTLPALRPAGSVGHGSACHLHERLAPPERPAGGAP